VYLDTIQNAGHLSWMDEPDVFTRSLRGLRTATRRGEACTPEKSWIA
jgi:hypothetical protein